MCSLMSSREFSELKISGQGGFLKNGAIGRESVSVDVQGLHYSKERKSRFLTAPSARFGMTDFGGDSCCRKYRLNFLLHAKGVHGFDARRAFGGDESCDRGE